MSFRYLLIVVAAMGLCTTAGAQEVDVTLSNSSALFRYIHATNSDFGQTETDAGLLYTDSNDFLVMFGIEARGEAGSGSPGLNAGVGVKGFTANTDAYDLLALAIGGELHYSPPAMNRLGFRAQVFHAPGIVTFLDADDFTYLALSVEYEVLQQATVYVGYRSVKSGLNGQGTATIDNDTHVGLRINF